MSFSEARVRRRSRQSQPPRHDNVINNKRGTHVRCVSRKNASWETRAADVARTWTPMIRSGAHHHAAAGICGARAPGSTGPCRTDHHRRRRRGRACVQLFTRTWPRAPRHRKCVAYDTHTRTTYKRGVSHKNRQIYIHARASIPPDKPHRRGRSHGKLQNLAAASASRDFRDVFHADVCSTHVCL